MLDRELKERIAQLQEEIFVELTSGHLQGRKHYARATYANGCRGPLCRKAERDRARKRYSERERVVGFKTRYNELVDAELERITALYLENNGFEVRVAT